jgi:ABC-type Fe3+-hydroxamate transport system substrate-binding protein
LSWQTKRLVDRANKINMNKTSRKFTLAILASLIVVTQSGCFDRKVDTSKKLPVEARRIISLAPSITEILFALDEEDRVVGVTRYCDYPPGALDKSRVGGYYDINYEALLSLEPDLVILLVEHTDAMKRLDELGIGTLPVDHSRVTGILDSITAIGERLGGNAAASAVRLKGELEGRIGSIDEPPGGSGLRVSGSGSTETSPPPPLVL